MGPQQSRYRPIENKFYCPICMDTLSAEKFKVLVCGHPYCIQCIESWFSQNLQYCPSCRTEERRRPQELSDVYSYEGTLYAEQSPDAEDQNEIQDLLHLQMVRRARTIL